VRIVGLGNAGGAHARVGSDAGGGSRAGHGRVVLGRAGGRDRRARDVDQAERDGRVGLARKTRPVDVPAAEAGEVVVTVIAGEGKETQSPPAQPGDLVVRNRCPETGNEEILVSAAKFAERYEGPLGPADGAGWQSYRPRGIEMAYFVVRAAEHVHLHRALGRADGGAPRRRYRARSARPGGHLSDRRSRVRVHLRNPAASALGERRSPVARRCPGQAKPDQVSRTPLWNRR
jgi:hypothetical protein